MVTRRESNVMSCYRRVRRDAKGVKYNTPTYRKKDKNNDKYCFVINNLTRNKKKSRIM